MPVSKSQVIACPATLPPHHGWTATMLPSRCILSTGCISRFECSDIVGASGLVMLVGVLRWFAVILLLQILLPDLPARNLASLGVKGC